MKTATYTRELLEISSVMQTAQDLMRPFAENPPVDARAQVLFFLKRHLARMQNVMNTVPLNLMESLVRNASGMVESCLDVLRKDLKLLKSLMAELQEFVDPEWHVFIHEGQGVTASVERGHNKRAAACNAMKKLKVSDFDCIKVQPVA